MNVPITRGERFKDARVVYNQHGKQTMDDVQKATNVSVGSISQMENDECTTDFGSNKVAALARHYGVSTDYLLGLSKDPTVDPDIKKAIKVTGLSRKAINRLSCMEEYQRAYASQLIALDLFPDLLSALNDYDAAGNTILQFTERLLAGFGETSSRRELTLVDDAYYSMSEQLTELRSLRFELNDLFLSILDRFHDARETISKAKAALEMVDIDECERLREIKLKEELSHIKEGAADGERS